VTADHDRSAGRPGPGDSFADEGIALIRERCEVVPRVAVVLGSGLGDAVAEDLQACHEFSFQTLPGFPRATVPGHAGRLAMGTLYGAPAAVFRGRIHYYEGHGIASTTLIPRLAAVLGTEVLILTNAAGGLDPSIRPGQLMLIRDHLNQMGVNPLFGWKLPDGSPAFVDVSAVYDPDLLAAATQAAERSGADVAAGIYAAMSGPSYETPTETAFLSRAGAQAVGMSTVPEAVAGTALGLRVLAISCITNQAGVESSHEEVLATARGAAADLRSILMGVVDHLTGGGGDPGSG
jgi:purine-nucleoside phosphorylase